MTIETIDDRLKKYERELEVLTAKHENTVRQYQQVITDNQARFQQIRGAIRELEFIKTQLNGAQPT